MHDVETIGKRFKLLEGMLNEKLRRCVAAAEAEVIGRGGAATRVRDLTARPSTAKLAALVARLTPVLDPRVLTLAKILGHVMPKPDRTQELDPPIEREMSIPLPREDQDRDR